MLCMGGDLGVAVELLYLEQAGGTSGENPARPSSYRRTERPARTSRAFAGCDLTRRGLSVATRWRVLAGATGGEATQIGVAPVGDLLQ